ncbi:cell division protein FtsA [bacterium]|nr:cell division protein FtsA [bacterium]
MTADSIHRTLHTDGFITGLDIGTSKIAVIIGEVAESGMIRIMGVGSSPSQGLKQGVVVNLEHAIESIRRAVHEAQLTSGLQIRDVIVGISGDHVKSINSRGVVAVSRSDREIAKSDVERVIEAAKAIALPSDQEVLHILPQEFIVDSRKGIKTPIGLNGVRLEAEVHIVTGTITASQNIVRCVEKSGLNVIGRVLESLASSEAVLTPDERDLGVAVVDLGGGNTDIAMFYDGTVRHTAIVGLGGQNVTNDVALGLRTSIDQAEKIKRNYGCAYAGLVSPDDYFVAQSIGGREETEVTHEMLCTIIQPRMEEIFSLISKEIKRSAFGDKMGAGIVLTGGGALLKGARELARDIFGIAVKTGSPHMVNGLAESVHNPGFSTGVGLVMSGFTLIKPQDRKLRHMKSAISSKLQDWLDKYKELFHF